MFYYLNVKASSLFIYFLALILYIIDLSILSIKIY